MKVAIQLAPLEHVRSVLLRVCDGLTVKDLDWRVFDDTKSIGEIIMHVAAFEYIIVSALMLSQEGRIEPEIWNTIKSGFAREARFDRPEGVSLAGYRAILEQVRLLTGELFQSLEGETKVGRSKVDISALTSVLALDDHRNSKEQYALLAKCVGTSFSDDGHVLANDMVDIVVLLDMHETYHRGQITFQKYLAGKHQDLPRGELLAQ